MTDRGREELVCILCPTGCRLRLRGNNSGVEPSGATPTEMEISGAACERGWAYALEEVVSAMRTFTGTVRVAGGRRPVVSVKSDRPVPRHELIDVAKVTGGTIADAPVAAGDEIAVGLPGGVKLIATATVRAAHSAIIEQP